VTQYLFTLNTAGDHELPPEQVRPGRVVVNALDDKMRDAGTFAFDSWLHCGTASATVVQKSGDGFLIADGAYTETKGHLAGFLIINVADFDEALKWAKTAAVAEQLSIEFSEGDLDDAIRANASLDALLVVEDRDDPAGCTDVGGGLHVLACAAMLSGTTADRTRRTE
jgi:hypothetical protein